MCLQSRLSGPYTAAKTLRIKIAILTLATLLTTASTGHRSGSRGTRKLRHWGDAERDAGQRSSGTRIRYVSMPFPGSPRSRTSMRYEWEPAPSIVAIANTRRISRVYLRGGQVDRAALRIQLNGGSAAATRPPTTN